MGAVSAVLLVLCVLRRKNAIGGWLLYFLAYVFVGGAVTVVNVANSLSVYRPSFWQGTNLYLPFLMSNAPLVLISLAEMATGIGLIRSMSWEWVGRMKLIAAAAIIARLVELGIDIVFFPSAVYGTVVRLIAPSAFLAYLFLSKRVRRVFLTKDWEQNVAAGYLDLHPRKAIIYTPSELDAMKNREKHPD